MNTVTDDEIDVIGYTSERGDTEAVIALIEAINSAKNNGEAFAAIVAFRKTQRIAAVRAALASATIPSAPADAAVLDEAMRLVDAIISAPLLDAQDNVTDEFVVAAEKELRAFLAPRLRSTNTKD